VATLAGVTVRAVSCNPKGHAGDFAEQAEAGYNNWRGEENENADSCASTGISAVCLQWLGLPARLRTHSLFASHANAADPHSNARGNWCEHSDTCHRNADEHCSSNDDAEHY
jgi:hypothetical protein